MQLFLLVTASLFASAYSQCSGDQYYTDSTCYPKIPLSEITIVYYEDGIESTSDLSVWFDNSTSTGLEFAQKKTNVLNIDLNSPYYIQFARAYLSKTARVTIAAYDLETDTRGVSIDGSFTACASPPCAIRVWKSENASVRLWTDSLTMEVSDQSTNVYYLYEVQLYGELRTPQPTDIPTSVPTSVPTHIPTLQPTDNPTAKPTDNPTAQPTDGGSAQITTESATLTTASVATTAAATAATGVTTTAVVGTEDNSESPLLFSTEFDYLSSTETSGDSHSPNFFDKTEQWWVLVIVGVVGLSLIGCCIWWLIRRKEKQATELSYYDTYIAMGYRDSKAGP